MIEKLAAGLVAFTWATSQATAGEITFQHTGVGSGSIGSTSFVGAEFVFTASGDTANRGDFGSGWWIDHDSATVSIEGVGLFDVLTGTRTYVNNNAQAVGLARSGLTGLSMLYGPVHPSFASWDMLSSVGPIVGQASIMQWHLGDISTTGGTLDMDSASTPTVFTGELCGGSGTAYCLGDGSDVACPCFGFGGLGEGCANSGGGGARMTGLGSACSIQDTLVFQIDGVPGERPGLILRGDDQVANPVGDGVLCTSGNSQRSQVQVTSAGSTTFTDFHGAPFGSVANVGAPTHFQFWYRDPDNACSGAGFNFSNAWSVTYQL